MAKSHIRDLARLLAEEYKKAEDILTDAGLLMQDTLLSPDEQLTFSKLKAEIDENLSLLSVALSAAAQGKISHLLKQAKLEEESITTPLADLVENLSAPDITDDIRRNTVQLVAMYNARLRNIFTTHAILEDVAKIANFPSNKKKQRKLLNRLADYGSLQNRLQVFYDEINIFKLVEKAFADMTAYLSELTSNIDVSDPVDDLSS